MQLSKSDKSLCVIGGPEEARTPDPLNANQVLSQLSYRPKSYKSGGPKWIRTTDPSLIRAVL